MTGERNLAERLIGFDARVSGADAWTEDRRAAYLLRDDVAVPHSIDPIVWPSFFDESAIARPSWVGPFQELWEDLARLERFLSDHGAPEVELVAFTIHDGPGRELAEFLGSHRARDPDGTDSALPWMTPAERDPSWRLLGYDVCDVWGLSGLANCGYDAGEAAALRAAWSGRLNERHLFETAQDAESFRSLSDERVSEHSPFCVCGIWRVR